MDLRLMAHSIKMIEQRAMPSIMFD